MVASLVWALAVLMYEGRWGFHEPVSTLELMGTSHLPDWADQLPGWADQRQKVKHPFKHREVEQLPLGADVDRSPSSEMTLARISNAFIKAVTPAAAAFIALLLGYWIIAGVRGS